MSDSTMTLYHIPGCPFSERVEILMHLKGLEGKIADHEIDISAPRPAWLLEKTGGVTSLPALDVPEGTLLESMVILRYLEDRFPDRPVAQRDPYKHAIESWLVALGAALPAAGYKMVMNQDAAQRDAMRKAVDDQFAQLNAFLLRHSSRSPYLFEEFGWAEVATTPMFKLLWFLEYYENYSLPASLERMKLWREACLAHPAARHPTSGCVPPRFPMTRKRANQPPKSPQYHVSEQRFVRRSTAGIAEGHASGSRPC